MQAFMIGSGWIFWALILLFIVIATPFIERDKSNYPFSGPFISFIILGAILYLTNRSLGIDEHLLDIAQHPLWPLTFIIVYVIAGVIWSFIKWYQLLLRFKNASSSDRKYEFKTEDVNGVSIPTAYKNKARLTSWLTFWPLSFTWFLLHKPFTSIYYWLADSYDRIAKRMLGDLYAPKENSKKS